MERPARDGGAVRTVRLELVLGALSTPALLAILALSVNLGGTGWIVGLAGGWAATALIAAGRVRSGDRAILPADWVTLIRAMMAAGVAGLVADAFDRATPVTAIITLACAALVLDAVDGPVARRTGTATPMGARFDGEVDAFLILALSVAVSRDYGGWVLAIGAVRYAFLVAGWALRWLAAPLPFRYWRKIVAAVQGIVLTIAMSGSLPRMAGMIAVATALVLLGESFGRDVLWLYRAGAGRRTRQVVRWTSALVAGAIIWAALVMPDRLDRLTPGAFARIPVEGLALVAVGLLLPRRPRRVLAALAGVVFGLLSVLKIFDMISYQQLDRPFDPVLDWSNLSAGVSVVRDSIGTRLTDELLVLVVLGLVLLVVVVTASAIRLSTVTARQRRRSARGLTAVGLIWVVSAAASLQLTPAGPVASTSAAGLAVTQVQDAVAAVHDQHQFEASLTTHDRYADIPAAQLLSGLRGKDVVVAFVESYGQVAVRDSSFAPGVDTVLRHGTTSLSRAGFSARSAFLDSPTFGGLSWLAHSTLQSGLWVDSQQRFDQLMQSERFTLSDAFGKAGWRTVSDNPSDWRAWPLGKQFYHYDKLYGTHDQGYHGPAFSWAKVPDQYTLARFQDLELSPGHRPLMAEIDLDSSHTPWTPLPRMVPWDKLGDGSVYDPMPAQGLTPSAAWSSTDTVRRLYGQSIQYSMRALTSWVARLHDNNLVLILLGDHQPATTVSGTDATHEVPISIVAHDPAVLGRIASWHWQDGLLPGPAAPVWPMDSFRNRLLDTFSSTPTAVAQGR
jgi:phosphatidylglycerophosphate synthase